MFRIRKIISTSLLVLVCVGVFFYDGNSQNSLVTKAYAQTQSTTTQATKMDQASVTNQIDVIFKTIISSVQDEYPKIATNTPSKALITDSAQRLIESLQAQNTATQIQLNDELKSGKDIITASGLVLARAATLLTAVTNDLRIEYRNETAAQRIDTNPSYVAFLNRIAAVNADKLNGLATTVRQSSQAIAEGNDAGAQALISATAETNATKLASTPNSCTSLNNFTIVGCLDSFVGTLISTIFVNLAVFFVYIGGAALDMSIKIGIQDFKKYSESLYPIWFIIKQITTLIVIFSGIYLAFLSIVGWKGGENFKRFIPFLILYAIFVNFSYPIIRTAIDYSNSFSIMLYNEAIGSNNTTGVSASSRLMTRLGIQGAVIDARSKDTAATQNDSAAILKTAGQSTATALVLVLLLLFIAWSFVKLALVMITRIIILIFAIVGSPLLFIDNAIPYVGEYAQKFRVLVLRALVSSIVLGLGLFLVLAILDAFNKGKQQMGTIDTITQLVIMAIIGGIVYVWSSSVPKIAGAVSESIGKVMGGALVATPMALGAAVGGRALKHTLGRYANHLNSDDGKQSGFGKLIDQNQTNFVGRSARRFTNLISSSKFDMRNTKSGQALLNTVGDKRTTFFKEGSKEDYQEFVGRKAKEYTELRGSISDSETRARLDEKYNPESNSPTRIFNSLTGAASIYSTAVMGKRNEDAEKAIVYLKATPAERAKMRDDDIKSNKGKLVSLFDDLERGLNNPNDEGTQKALNDPKTSKEFVEAFKNASKKDDEGVLGFIKASDTEREKLLKVLPLGRLQSNIDLATAYFAPGKTDAERKQIEESLISSGHATLAAGLANEYKERNSSAQKKMSEYVQSTQAGQAVLRSNNTDPQVLQVFDFADQYFAPGKTDAERKQIEQALITQGYAPLAVNLVSEFKERKKKTAQTAAEYAQSNSAKRAALKREHTDTNSQQVFSEIDSHIQALEENNVTEAARIHANISEEAKAAISTANVEEKKKLAKEQRSLISEYFDEGDEDVRNDILVKAKKEHKDKDVLHLVKQFIEVPYGSTPEEMQTSVAQKSSLLRQIKDINKNDAIVSHILDSEGKRLISLGNSKDQATATIKRLRGLYSGQSGGSAEADAGAQAAAHRQGNQPGSQEGGNQPSNTAGGGEPDLGETLSRRRNTPSSNDETV